MRMTLLEKWPFFVRFWICLYIHQVISLHYYIQIDSNTANAFKTLHFRSTIFFSVIISIEVRNIICTSSCSSFELQSSWAIICSNVPPIVFPERTKKMSLQEWVASSLYFQNFHVRFLYTLNTCKWCLPYNEKLFMIMRVFPAFWSL